MISIDGLRAKFTALQDWSENNRGSLLPLAGIVFTGALVWAVFEAELRPSSMSPGYTAALFLVVTPLSLVFNAIGISISAWALNAKVPLGRSVKVFASGVVADITPVPGSFLVHSGALVFSGVSPKQVAALMLGRLLFLVGVALALAASAAKGSVDLPTISVVACGAVLALAGAATLVACCGVVGAVAVSLHRLLAFVFLSFRIYVAFSALGSMINPAEAALLAIAGIVGSAGFMTPGGLGLTEAMAALMAVLIALNPAFAFAAMALNRIAMLAVCGLVCLAALGKADRETVQ